MKRFISAVSLVFLAACGGGNSSRGGNHVTPVVAKMNISDAASLVIKPGKTSSSLAGVDATTVNKLFKVNKDGYLLEVTLTDENGKTVTTTDEPLAVYDINSSYVVVHFTGSSYLVSKSDGKAYEFNKGGGFSGPYQSYKNLYSDSAGNIYYLSSTRVKKITISGSSISEQYVSPNTDCVYGFTIDKNGNVFYPGRMIAANGAIVNLSSNYQETWIAPDGNVYVRKSPWMSGQGNIFKVSVDSNNVFTFVKYGELSQLENIYNYIMLQNRLISIDIGLQNKFLYAHELYNPSSSPRDIPGLPLTTVKTFANSDNYYYLSGNDASNNPSLIKVDPTDDSYINVLPVGQFEVYKMTVTKDDNVLIYALRMSDGINVIASISSKGQLTVLDQIDNSSSVVLQSVN